MFKKIVVAVDESEHRHTVLHQASELASHFNAELFVISVLDLAQRWQIIAPESVSTIIGSQESAILQMLDDIKQQLQELGIAVSTELLEGDAPVQIAAFAEQMSADLIVIGHRHLSRLRRIVENSVARSLVARAPCSVMITLEKKSAQL